MLKVEVCYTSEGGQALGIEGGRSRQVTAVAPATKQLGHECQPVGPTCWEVCMYVLFGGGVV